MKTLQDIKEILVIHHSHTDIGYTHPQPILWELERRFIDQAIDLCERTAGWPEPSQMRWTCETTGPVMHWLQNASGRQIERFGRLAAAGRISVGGMFCNLTPLYNTDQLARSLQAVGQLRQQFGLPMSVAINQDVNGLPWPVTQLLLDTDIKLLIMGINVHFGGFPLRRPMAFRWQGSDGRLLKVFNGEHYGIIQRICRVRENSTAAMALGLEEYLQFQQFSSQEYPYDFLYLTLTHSLFWDNNPPYPQAVNLIKRWNDEGRTPTIRFITPEQLLKKLEEQPEALLPVHVGDWTDWWNFGCASAAVETRVNRDSRARLATANLLRVANGTRDDETRKRFADAHWNLNLHDEHTWGHFASVSNPEWDGCREQWYHKAHYAYQARSLSSLLLRDQMDALCQNPNEGEGCQGLLVLNPAPGPRKVFVRAPLTWLDGSWLHFSSMVHSIDVQRESWDDTNSRLIGPIELAGNSYQIIPIALLPAAVDPVGIESGENLLESPFHRLRFDPATGRITSLFDKQLGWEVVDVASPWSFFGFIQESVDPARHSFAMESPPFFEQKFHGRNALFTLEYDGLRQDLVNWKSDWPVLRQGPQRLKSHRIEKTTDGVSLVLNWTAPGVNQLQQRIKLFAHRPGIELTATFQKQDILTPEGIYFSFPCRLDKWRAHYDTADLPVEFDAEQLPGTARDWVTVDHWVSLHDPGHGVTLACPDAPMVQIGGFNFGKNQRQVPRADNPLLLAWPMNNYWNTNFRPSQPGFQRFRYELFTHGAFDPAAAALAGWMATMPVEVHPVLNAPEKREGNFLRLETNANVLPLAVKLVEENGDVLVRLANVSTTMTAAGAGLPDRIIRSASNSGPLEDDRGVLPVTEGLARVILAPRSITTVLLKGES